MSQQGTARKQNEDRSCVATDLGSGVGTMAAVFDGHGGYATAEWLQENFPKYIRKYWGEVGSPEAATTELAFLAADRSTTIRRSFARSLARAQDAQPVPR